MLHPARFLPVCLLWMLDCEDRAVRARGFKVLCCPPSLPSHHPSRSSYSAPDKVQWLTGKQGREVAACPQRGFHGTWLLSGRPLAGTESICSTNHRHTVTSFFPVLIFFSLRRCIISLLFSVSDRARGCDGSRPSKDEGWGEPLAIPV